MYVGDMAVKLDDGRVVRAKPISWNDFNRWWYVWHYEAKTGVMIKRENVSGDRPIGESDVVAQNEVKAEQRASTTPSVQLSPRLPAGVPEVIEIDVGGREPKWVIASVVKVSGQQLLCRLNETGETRKANLIGRDIEWRVPVTV